MVSHISRKTSEMWGTRPSSENQGTRSGSSHAHSSAARLKPRPDTKQHSLALETQRQQTGREVNDKFSDLGQTLDAFPLGHIGLFRICPNQVAPCKKLNFYLTCI